MEDAKYVLELKNICKSFPGVKALDHVSFHLKAGTVHALMGENGAGKSTLMKCIFGLYDPDEGEIFIKGQRIKLGSPKMGLDAGVSMIPQELNPVRMRSVAENIWLNRIPEKKILGMNFVDHKKMHEKTVKLFEELGIKMDTKALAGEISAAQQQFIEIAKATSYDANIIIMDEPTSSLSDKDAEKLFEVIRRLKDRGVAIIYTSHKIDEIKKIADEITIMRDGKIVGTWPAEEMAEEHIVANMVGRQMKNWFPKVDNVPGEIVFEVEGFTSVNKNSFKNCSFFLRKGEILGVSGLVGAQRTELMEAIFGYRKIAAGTLKKSGRLIKNRSPKEAISNGFALLTEERKATGIIPLLSVKDNMVTASIDNYSKLFGMLDLKMIAADVSKYVRSVNIKTPALTTEIQNLSGGNQQKVLIARWLLTDSDILIMDEPTRGIDVGAKNEIYNMVLELAKNGKSIIFISSEMPEIIGISNRVMVMCEGHISGFLSREELSEQRIMNLASSVHIDGAENNAY